MSNPVTHADVEDVLSSIRRLVSDERSVAANTDEISSVNAASNRLVLTDALRVAEPEAPTSDGEVIAGFVEIEPEDVENSTTAEMLQIFTDAAHTSRDAPSVYELTPENIVSPPQEAHELAKNTPDAEQLAVHSATLGAKIAALEAAVNRRHDEWEPDAPGQDAYAGTTDQSLDWEQSAVPGGISENDEDNTRTADEEALNTCPAPQLTPSPSPELPRGTDMIDDVLDEVALRDLVAEIVREELKGSLGERITRNVRKLVRREIRRALTSQGLE